MKKFVFIFGTVVAAIFVALDSPRYFAGPSKGNCINNLRHMEAAKQQWVLERHKMTNDTPSWEDLRPYLPGPRVQCPDGGAYTIGRVDQLPSCSLPRHDAFWKQAYVASE